MPTKRQLYQSHSFATRWLYLTSRSLTGFHSDLEKIQVLAHQPSENQRFARFWYNQGRRDAIRYLVSRETDYSPAVINKKQKTKNRV